MFWTFDFGAAHPDWTRTEAGIISEDAENIRPLDQRAITHGGQ